MDKYDINCGKKTNMLINEKSPYLLQHAYNPVKWYPWKEEAFEKAKEENKPIFLSIGYSTCHWCHVMEEESFEDEDVAKILNDNFISIKVDREERPDIDNIYMTVCQMITGSGGWPLTIIMTPDKNPFYAATYIPKENRYGRPGMLEILPRIKGIWDNDYDSIDKSVKGIASHIKTMEKSIKGKGISKETFEKAYNQFKNTFDSDKGGFGKAPKFPTTHNMMFLLRYYKVKGEKHSLNMVEKTLDEMAKGGIFDHVGYGFHRYSTDSNWILPHFEKMLYDQALISMAYIEAYQVTGKEVYKTIAEKILKYVLRDMTSDEGGFYSAEDADSEGEEGKFYIWEHDEIKNLLSNEEFEIAKRVFNIKKDGNFTDESTNEKNGFNILYMSEEIKDKNIDISIKNIREKLFNYRIKRQRPLRDEKILTDWNGLMIAALSKAYCAFSNEEYLEAAKKAEKFICSSTDKNKRILHRYFKGEWDISASVDDYAFYVYGLIELYEATFDVSYINKATQLTNEMIEHFRDKENGGLYFTPNDGEKLIIRNKEIYDGAVPSGNSVAAYNLIRLSKIVGINSYGIIANEINMAFSNQIEEMPSAYTMMLIAMDFVINNSFEVIIVGDTIKNDTREMINLLRNNFLPNVVVTLNPSISESNINEISNYPQSHLVIDNKATAYVCSEGMCMQPTNDLCKLKNYIMI